MKEQQNVTILREYDRVKVARLLVADREFEGTEGVTRAPRLGDVATLCHGYDPRGMAGPVAVEMVNDQGYTVWLADFELTELEFVSRS